ncbi:MAG: tetratricopeptide repeat protein [Terriglobales bacterium]
MKRRHWFTNRVLWGLVLFMIAVGIWEFRYKPQYRPYYENGVSRYQAGDYAGGLAEFQRAYTIAPNATDVLLMLGWSNLKLHRFEEARFYFDRALKIDPRISEARLGASFVVLETGRGELDVTALSRALEQRPKDANIQVVAAGALVEQGENLKAAEMYRALLKNASYSRAADAALRVLYGLDDSEPIPSGLPDITPPGQVQVRYRAGDNAIWEKNKDSWQKFYIAGVNLVPATPGLTPGTPPIEGAFYSLWVQQASELGANTLHVHSLLPPAFYRAYRRASAAPRLLQQISFDFPSGADLFEPKSYAAAKAEIRYVIDAVHGHGNIPHRGRRGSGLYVADVSANVIGFVVGDGFDPSIVMTTDLRNPQKTGYSGKYVGVNGATATESWIAEMLDYAAQYETETYGWQHPVAFANWPALDPMSHPSESQATRNDVVSINESKFQTKPAFTAGVFASYALRPYYPDFLLREARYQGATDAEGPNPMAGYVRDLRSRISLPLVISDFGIPSAIGVSHVQRGGWNQGGISESEQAAFLTRMARAFRDAGCAGASVFEIADEWYRANNVAATFESPRDRAALWLNQMSSDSGFGLVGFHTSKWQLFAGDASAWKSERVLYQNPAPAGIDPAHNLRSVQASADEAFLYLRFNLECVECREHTAEKGSPVQRPAFAVAINSLPDSAGIQNLPFGKLRLASGANFLLYVGPETAQLLVAGNYNPFYVVTAPGAANQNELRQRQPFTPTVQPQGKFEEMLVQITEAVYGRDGVFYPAQRYSQSSLRRGTDSLSEWLADAAHHAIVVRIPWAKLLVTDPSSMRVFFGFTPAQQLRSNTSPGFQISVFALQPGGTAEPQTWNVAASFPRVSGGTVGTPEVFGWKTWNSVNPEAYRKAAFSAVQKEYADETGRGSPPARRASAQDRARGGVN